MSSFRPHFDVSLVAKRFGSAMIDGSIELGGGLLGSYFGVMVAALLVAIQNQPAEELQHSMYNGMGFGFVFWALSISFINRVLIQGLSRASLGKKFFKLELVSSGQPLTWTTITTRWLLSYVSLAFGGLGYAYLFLNPEARAFHDVVAQTDIVPAFEGARMSEEFKDDHNVIPFTAPQAMARVIIMSNTQAERPMATIIRLPIRAAMDAAIALGGGTAPVMAFHVLDSEVQGQNSIAEVIELHPVEEKDEGKKAA